MEERIKSMISALRKGSKEPALWSEFEAFIENNLDELCETLNTRWLVSICDTYADHGDAVTRRNAMLVVQIANFEKLWATYLLMYDVKENPEKVKQLKNNKIIPLWDGMYSFNINHGDLTNNLFSRLDALMPDTPVIDKIYQEVIRRLKSNNTVLSKLDEYHGKLFDPYPRRSIFRIIRKKIRMLFKSYKP